MISYDPLIYFIRGGYQSGVDINTDLQLNNRNIEFIV
jgi:hypothetical protein